MSKMLRVHQQHTKIYIHSIGVQLSHGIQGQEVQ